MPNACVILPAEATEEMVQIVCTSIVQNDDAEKLIEHLSVAAPNAGKVSAEMLEAAARALCELDIRNKRRWDTTPEHLEEILPRSVDLHWRDYLPETRAAFEAIGLTVEG